MDEKSIDRNDNLSQHFDADLQLLLDALAVKIEAAQEITQLRSATQKKAVYKLTLTDGRILKARRHQSERHRLRVSSLMPLLSDLPLARVVAERGKVTLEEWVEGAALGDGGISREQIYAAGEILGLMHGKHRGELPVAAEESDAGWHLEKIRIHLETVVSSGSLTLEEAREIVTIADQCRPEMIETGVIHGDYCAENIVLTPAGELTLVDNEAVRVGPLDYDIARSWCRWPMVASQREAFADGYQRNRPMDRFYSHQRFWAIRALALSMNVHAKHGKPKQIVLDALLRLGSGSTGALWPVDPKKCDSVPLVPDKV